MITGNKVKHTVFHRRTFRIPRWRRRLAAASRPVTPWAARMASATAEGIDAVAKRMDERASSEVQLFWGVECNFGRASGRRGQSAREIGTAVRETARRRSPCAHASLSRKQRKPERPRRTCACITFTRHAASKADIRARHKITPVYFIINVTCSVYRCHQDRRRESCSRCARS